MAERSVAKRRNGKGDLNRAQRDELMAVPGIGPATADAILKHREERGAFESLDQLDEVTGLGTEATGKLRARFAVPGKGASPGRSGEGAAKAAAQSAREAAETSMAAAGKAGETVAETARDMGEPGANVAAEAGRTSVEEAKAESAATADTLGSARQAAASAPDETARGAEQAAETLATSTGGVLEGVQEWHRVWLGCAQEQLEDTVAAGRDLARCRSPQDLIEVQLRYARSSMERFVTGSARLAEVGARIAGAGAHPLQSATRLTAWTRPESVRD